MEEMIKHQEDAVEKARVSMIQRLQSWKTYWQRKMRYVEKEILKAVESSGKTFEEIIEFLTEGKN